MTFSFSFYRLGEPRHMTLVGLGGFEYILQLAQVPLQYKVWSRIIETDGVLNYMRQNVEKKEKKWNTRSIFSDNTFNSLENIPV